MASTPSIPNSSENKAASASEVALLNEKHALSPSASEPSLEQSNPLAGGCRCPAPCVSHPELTAVDAPPLNELAADAAPKRWDDLTLAEQAQRVADALWDEIKSQHPIGGKTHVATSVLPGDEPPTITIGYLFAANVCGVLRNAASTIESQASELVRLRGLESRAKELLDNFHLQDEPEAAMGYAYFILHGRAILSEET